MNRVRMISMALLAVFSTAFAGRLPAADPPKPAVIESTDFLTIPLKNVDVAEITPSIEALIGPLGGVSIPIVHMNAIIISGPKDRIAELRKLVEQLDVAPRKAVSQNQLRVFSLKSVAADKNVEKMLGVVMQGRPNARFAIDPARNQVIVYGDEQVTDMVTALLSRLETAPELKSNSDMQVRIIWLVNGAAEDKAQKLPEDLGAVLPALARMGIDKPVLAAQTMVVTSVDNRFVTKGTARVDQGAPCDFSVSGTARDSKDGSRLSLNLQAWRANQAAAGFGNPQQSRQEVCHLETEITSPLGHIVVLGMTPTEKLTSVFLVQLRRVEPLAGGK